MHGCMEDAGMQVVRAVARPECMHAQGIQGGPLPAQSAWVGRCTLSGSGPILGCALPCKHGLTGLRHLCCCAPAPLSCAQPLRRAARVV